ncbi:MAG: transketolase [Bacteroidales bacterium]|jgi:transketolase|nr:transketolase [Bacteroidales bacterium]
MNKVEELERIALQVRRDIIRMVFNAQSGHPGGSLSCTDMMVALYFEAMNIDPKNFSTQGRNEDMFFLSNGHISPLWYSVLSRRGYFDVKNLSSFRFLHSPLQGHPSPRYNIPGIRIASGSLGQGLSVAIGAALAKKMNNDENIVFSLHGDGELQEGQIWEGVLYAGAKKVDNLISIIDYNNAQIDGSVDEVLSLGDLKAKFLSFNWIVLEAKGNDMEDCLRVLFEAKQLTKNNKPIVILMHTLMGFAIDFMQGKNSWHGKAPNKEQTEIALAQLEETLGDF